MTPPRKKQRLSPEPMEGDAVVETQPAAEPAAEPATDEKSQAQQQRRSLFVRSLPASATTESLTELFSQSYPIKHATAVIDRETKQCKGYGFVTFADVEDCQRAKEEFDGYLLDGRKLRVEVAEPRHRDSETAPAINPAQAVKERIAKEKAEARQPPKLIVRNLPWSIKKPDQLAKLFMSYGKVKEAKLPNKKPGLLTGFGFVTMRGHKNAEKAMEGVNGKEVDGRTLAVDWAVKKDVWQGMQGEGEAQTDDAEEDAELAAEEEDVSVEVDGEVSQKEDWEDENEDEDGELGSEDEEDMEDGLDEDEDDDFAEKNKTEDKSSTLFVRNLPFSCTDEDLEDHFTQFGSVRYARIVIDHATERPRGTGFVCFYKKEDAEECLKGAPRQQAPKPADKGPKGQVTHSILQNEDNDPSGKYTLESRVLQVAPAVNKSEATRLREEGVAYRNHRDRDKRRLYLLSEGTIPSNSPQYEKLSPSERTMREASMKQRKNLIESNPSLHLSLTRLSVRNIPRSVTSKDLKQLAREAVVGFATDVKAGKRQRLSKEELARGGEEMQEAEKDRRSRAKGLVKQAKIVFEGREGSKVDEKSGAGRSRGYGFIEYYTHRNALMGLRWLNGHAIDYSAIEKAGKGKKLTQEVIQDRKKRLIVEFAIENAQVVGRRKEREGKAKERAVTGDAGHNDARTASGKGSAGQKRKRGGGGDDEASQPEPPSNPADEKLAKRQRIIQKKRMVRRARKKGAKA